MKHKSYLFGPDLDQTTPVFFNIPAGYIYYIVFNFFGGGTAGSVDMTTLQPPSLWPLSNLIHSAGLIATFRLYCTTSASEKRIPVRYLLEDLIRMRIVSVVGNNCGFSIDIEYEEVGE